MTGLSTNRLQKSHFSTTRLPGDQRVQVWRESIGTLFDITASTRYAEDAFDASLTSYLLNEQIMFSRCETRAQRFDRSALRSAMDGIDYYLIQTLESGSQKVRRGSKESQLRPGELLIIDLADAHRADTSDFTNLSLVVPRPLLAPHLLHPDSHGSRILQADAPMAALAVNHLKTLAAVIGNMSAAQGLQTIEPTVMLLASALNGSAETVCNGSQAIAMSVLARAKLLIERNLQRNLSIEKLCGELRLSRATLYRLFEPSGGVQSYIQQRRLQRCAEALTHPAHSRQRIYQIAFSWGFSSEAHFSRAFRQRFGISPREARLAGSLQPRSLQQVQNELVGDRDYERWLSERLRS